MKYQRTVGYCFELATKLDEMVSVRCPYEAFDDPVSAVHFSHNWEIDKAWARRDLIDLLKGRLISHECIGDMVELLSVIEDEALLDCITAGPLFELVVHDDGFYAATVVTNNKRPPHFQLALEAVYEARFRRNQPNAQF